jgi:hypothetical protein
MCYCGKNPDFDLCSSACWPRNLKQKEKINPETLRRCLEEIIKELKNLNPGIDALYIWELKDKIFEE